MSSHPVVKLERLEDEVAVALTPVTVKQEIPVAVQAESSTSRRRSARHITLPPSPETEREDVKPAHDDDIFAVGGIVAKSLGKGDGPWGSEHQYLIRWEGYGPKGDTWEWNSNVAHNAKEMLDDFDRHDHPFNVVDSALHGNKTKYLVESCAMKNSRDGLWSPLAERGWMFAYQLRDKRRISPEAIKRGMQGWQASAFPTPPSSVRGKKRKHASEDEDEEDEEGDEEQRRISSDGKHYTHRKLLKIVDEERYRKNQGPWYTRYKVRHRLRDRGRAFQTREEWYTNTYMLQIFGAVAVHEQLRAYMPEHAPNGALRADGAIVPAAEVTDYEKDRLRRMKENDDLMKQLGLAL